jgi:hypothetical protein
MGGLKNTGVFRCCLLRTNIMNNSESLTMCAAFFSTKVEGMSLRESLENISAITLRRPSM